MKSYFDKTLTTLAYMEDIYKAPFMCAGFARRYAEILLTGELNDKKDEIYNRASAWNFQYGNKKIWSLEDCFFDPKILKTGMIAGIKLPHSIFNRRRDSRGNPVRNTHMAVIKEVKQKECGLEYIIAHNVGGINLCENLFDFLQRNDAHIVDIFCPKDAGLIKT